MTYPSSSQSLPEAVDRQAWCSSTLDFYGPQALSCTPRWGRNFDAAVDVQGLGLELGY